MIPREKIISSWRYEFEKKFAELEDCVLTSKETTHLLELEDPSRVLNRAPALPSSKELAKMAIQCRQFDTYWNLRKKNAKKKYQKTNNLKPLDAKETNHHEEEEKKDQDIDNPTKATQRSRKALPHKQVFNNNNNNNNKQVLKSNDAVARQLAALLSQSSSTGFLDALVDQHTNSIWPETKDFLQHVERREQESIAAIKEKARKEALPYSSNPALLSPEESALQSKSDAVKALGRPRLNLEKPEQSKKEQEKLKLFELYQTLHQFVNRSNGACSPQVKYLTACLKNMILPEPLHLQGEDKITSLNLANFGINDQQASALADALRAMKKLRSLELPGNRLSGQGVISLTTNIPLARLRILDLSHNNISSQGMQAVTSLVSSSNALHVLKLNNVGAKPQDFASLCAALKKSGSSVRVLHLADNGLSNVAAEGLGDMLRRNMSITSLNLSWNSLSSQGAEAFLDGLQRNLAVQTLDLRWNLLGTAVQALSKALGRNKALTHLDLSHNQLNAEQCKTLALGLNANQTILGLHMAGNAYAVSPAGYLLHRKNTWQSAMSGHYALNQDKVSICAASYSKTKEEQTEKPSFLKTPSAMTPSRRTSISTANTPVASSIKNRRFKSFRSAVIAVSTLTKALRPIKPDLPEVEETPGPDTAQHFNRVNNKAPVFSLSKQSQNECQSCWICGRWREVRLEFVDYASAEQAVVREVNEELQRKKDKVFRPKLRNKKRPKAPLPPPLDVSVYLSSDGFARPYQMEYIKGDFKYEVYVMLPPGPCEFFFVVNNSHVVLAPNQHTLFASERMTKKFDEFIKKRRLPGAVHRHYPTVWRGREAQELEAKEAKTPKGKKPGEVPQLRLHAVCVVERAELRLPADIKARPRCCRPAGSGSNPFSFNNQGWNKSLGVFSSYPIETTDFVVRSFQADCKHGKFHKFLPDEQDRYETLLILQENYSLLRVVYTLFCANSTGPSVSAVSWNAFTELCQLCDIPDRNCTVADLDNIFVATNVNDSEETQMVSSDGKKLNPDRDLCRYEFLEIMARIAVQKFVAPGKVESPGEGLRKLIDEHFIPKLDIENPQAFRERYLWTEQVNKLFSKYLPVLKQLFNKTADAKVNRKNKRMSITGWKNFLLSAGMFSQGGCSERDAKLAYRLSMINVVDEMSSEDFLSISFVEFLEAFGRIAYLSDVTALAKFVRSFEREFYQPKGGAQRDSTSSTVSFFSEEYQDKDVADRLRKTEHYKTWQIPENPMEESSDNEQGAEDDEDDDIDDGNDTKAGFPKKLAFLLRLMIWHPAIYDRNGAKSKLPREKLHGVLLKEHPSKAVPNHL